MNNEHAIKTTIPYFKWDIQAYWNNDKTRLFIPVKHLCKKLGISHTTQVRKILRDPSFNPIYMSMTYAHMSTTLEPVVPMQYNILTGHSRDV